MFPFFCRAQKELAYEQGVRDGRQAQADKDRMRREALDRMAMVARLGAPVIVVPNEWDNPVIGFGHDLMTIGSSTVLVVKNYVTDALVWCGGVTMDFSEQRLEIALSLDPFQLWAITAHNAVGHEDFTKPKSSQRWDRQAILDALERHGFFERWRDFKAQRQANTDR